MTPPRPSPMHVTRIAGVLLAAILIPRTALPSDIKPDEVVTFFSTFAHLTEDKRAWIVPIHGWIYEPEQDSAPRDAALALFRRSIGLTEEEAKGDIFQRRARLFLVDDERGKKVSIRIGARQYDVGESDANGHFTGEVRLGIEDAAALRSPDGWIAFHAVIPPGDPRVFTGRVQLVGETGLSVISDIDDTIKITEVRDRKALLRNTFAREFRAVPGMARAYQRWTDAGANFHYVSTSPWHLSEPLQEFVRSNEYPLGSFHLREFRWRNQAFSSLSSSPDETKRAAIEPILAALPRRRFILVGDSGERDPEIYGGVARAYPQQVFHIFIRDVTGEGRTCERFATAFEGIEGTRWTIFTDPGKIASLPLPEP